MKLTLVGLPLGNIEDISLRAIKTLQNAQFVICEDTRVFHKLWQKLLNLGHLSGPFTGQLTVINEFNEKAKVDSIIEQLALLGEAVLVSDAGLPAISDPGYVLVKTVIKQGGGVDIIPGPTAAMTALTVSGFPADRVLYLGFLPKKTSKRNKNWQLLKDLIHPSPAGLHPAMVGCTAIIYESPLRVAKTLLEIQTQFGDVPAVIARELTKEHQQILRGSVAELLSQISARPLKGEVVLLIRI